MDFVFADESGGYQPDSKRDVLIIIRQFHFSVSTLKAESSSGIVLQYDSNDKIGANGIDPAEHKGVLSNDN